MASTYALIKRTVRPAGSFSAGGFSISPLPLEVPIDPTFKTTRPPRFGTGYMAGTYPDGLTTDGNVPVSAEVIVQWRGPAGHPMDGVVCGRTVSAQDGTWRVDGLNPALTYDVKARMENRNDAIRTQGVPRNPPRFSETALTVPVGMPLDYDLPVIGGEGAVTVTLSSGTPPSGVSYASGKLTGTWPTGTLGQYPLTFALTDDTQTNNVTFTLDLILLPITLPATPAVPYGLAPDKAMTPIRFKASGGEGPYTIAVSSGALPTGTSLTTIDSETVEWSGTPSSGDYDFTMQATGVRGTPASKSYHVVVAPQYRYWRVNVTANNGNSSYLTIAEVELRATVGGSDLTTPAAAASGAATASSEANSSNVAMLAFDDEAGNKWTAAGATGWLEYDCGSPVAVAEVAIMGQYPAGGQGSMTPKDFTIEARVESTDPWTVLHTAAGETGWAGGEVRTFSV